MAFFIQQNNDLVLNKYTYLHGSACEILNHSISQNTVLLNRIPFGREIGLMKFDQVNIIIYQVMYDSLLIKPYISLTLQQFCQNIITNSLNHSGSNSFLNNFPFCRYIVSEIIPNKPTVFACIFISPWINSTTPSHITADWLFKPKYLLLVPNK